MSKGSKRRPVDEKSYQDNWDKIFGNTTSDPKEDPLPDYGDLMPLKDFLEAVDCNAFTPYDGTGYYVFNGKMYDPFSFQDYYNNGSHLDFPEIIWFNK